MSASDDEPTTVNVVLRIEPFLHRTGVPYRGDVQGLAEQVCQWVAENVSERLTAEHDSAGLFVAVATTRGEEKGGWQYREGHYVKEPAPVASLPPEEDR